MKLGPARQSQAGPRSLFFLAQSAKFFFKKRVLKKAKNGAFDNLRGFGGFTSKLWLKKKPPVTYNRDPARGLWTQFSQGPTDLVKFLKDSWACLDPPPPDLVLAGDGDGDGDGKNDQIQLGITGNSHHNK